MNSKEIIKELNKIRKRKNIYPFYVIRIYENEIVFQGKLKDINKIFNIKFDNVYTKKMDAEYYYYYINNYEIVAVKD